MDEVLLSNIVMNQTLVKQGYKVVGTIAPVENTVGIHQTYIESYTILDKEDNDVTNLFDVKLNPGRLTIYYEQISISVGSASKAYDGTPLVNEVITGYDDSNLMPGHHLNPEIIFTTQGKVEIGKYVNDIQRTNLVLDSEGNDVTYMYDVIVITGTLTIEKRDLVILGGSYDFEDELEYPGQKLFYKEYEIIEGSLLAGHKIVSFEMTEDSYVNDENSGAENLVDRSSIVIEDSEGNDVTQYYNIICEPGEIYYLG